MGTGALRSRLFNSCTLALSLALPLPLAAQTQNSAEDSKTSNSFDLGQITVVGQADSLTVGSSSVSQIAIETFNRVTLDDAAALIPGVSASNSGGSRNEQLLFIRGFDRFQAPLSIDGIRVYLPADNRLDYSRFMTPDLAEIQVAKGYASVLDGPGAMGGAINLVTRKPAKDIEVAARVTMDLDRDLDASGYNMFGLIGTRQDMWYAQASYTRSYTDHWDLPGGYVPTNNQAAGERDFSETEDWRINAKIGFTPNANDEYSISYTRQEGSKNAPLHVTDTATQRNWSWPYWNIDSLYFLSRTALSDDLLLKTRVYRNSFNNLLSSFDNRTQSSQTLGRAFNSYYEDVAWGGSAELALSLRETDRLSVALHYRSDEHVEFQQSFPAGTTEPPQTNKEDTWSVAGEYVAALTPALKATIGASYDWRNLHRAEEYGTPPGGGASAIFSYPLRNADAVNLQGRLDWGLDSGTRLYASVSSRTRFPTVFERFSSRFGGATSNADLQSERATNFELGGTLQRGVFSVTGAAFYSLLSDVIVSVPFIYQDQSVNQSQNVGDGESYGAELSVVARISSTFTLGGNYTWLKRDLNDTVNPAMQPVGVPTHKAFLFADWRPVEGLSFVPSLDIASDRWTVTTSGTRYYRTGSYVDGGFRIGYDLNDNVTVAAGVRNAFDGLYYLTDGFPQGGRRFFLSVAFKN